MLRIVGIAILTFIFMEAWAWWVHKYLLHGPLWFLHRSHHRVNPTWWEWNDLVSVFYALLAGFLIIWGIQTPAYWAVGLGAGITIYGIFYFIFHDIIIHRRIKVKSRFSHPYIKRLIRAHKIHHKHQQKEDSEAFGFLFAARKYQPK